MNNQSRYWRDSRESSNSWNEGQWRHDARSSSSYRDGDYYCGYYKEKKKQISNRESRRLRKMEKLERERVEGGTLIHSILHQTLFADSFLPEGALIVEVTIMDTHSRETRSQTRQGS